MPVPDLLGKNSTLLLGLKVVYAKRDKGNGGPIGREGAQQVVDFAAKDGFTYAESRLLSRLDKDTFTPAGQKVLDGFVQANPVAPPTDGPERLAGTQRAIDRAVANGKVSLEDVKSIRDTFKPLEVTPETLAQQCDAVQRLLDRSDVKFGRAGLARAELEGVLRSYRGG
ncbi:MAG TPA: hypothetical protein VND93_08165 [Myxococcales bacterium]|jgi:hypothetical protein|nr:hypothetical protein [Myxococcales bacterium]